MENTSYLRADRQQQDFSGEKIVGQYLDKYFYPTFTTTVTRNDEKATQVQGLDLTATTEDGYTYTIDEKAALWYANKDLQTFAQEISSRYTGEYNPRRGELYNGWAISHTLNNYYVFVWIPECKTTGKVLNVTDIITTDVALIKKQDLYEWYHKKGLSASDMLKKSDELRKTVDELGLHDWWNYVTDCSNISLYGKGYKYHINTKTEENSVNLLLDKNVILKQIATYSVRIKDGKIIDTYRKRL